MTTAAENKQKNSNNNEEEEKRFCRICYGTDEDSEQLCGIDLEWVHPCRCSGTIKWVHRGCFSLWHEQAPDHQRKRCNICSYFYRFSPRLKPRWYTKFDVTFQVLALLAIFKLVYDLTSFDLHAIFASFIIFCLVMAMEYRLQLQLLERYKIQLQMHELLGLMFHANGEEQRDNDGLIPISSSQSVFEESIQNAV